MRILLAGFSIVLLSLFVASTPVGASEENDLVCVSAPADAPSDAVSAPDIDEASAPSDQDVSQADDVELTDEEVVEMACLPKYFQCSVNSQCCSGICRLFSGGGKVCW